MSQPSDLSRHTSSTARPSGRSSTVSSRSARPKSLVDSALSDGRQMATERERKAALHEERWGNRAMGLETLIGGDESLLKRVPEPYMINSLCIGSFDTTDLDENERAYERYHFFRDINKAARGNYPPLYDFGDGSGTWLQIDFNVAWTKFLVTLDVDVGSNETEDQVRCQLDKDAKVKLPDTDLSTAMQDILKAEFFSEIIDAEFQRRLNSRRSRRHKQKRKQRQAQRPRQQSQSQHQPRNSAQLADPPHPAMAAEQRFQKMGPQVAIFSETPQAEEPHRLERRSTTKISPLHRIRDFFHRDRGPTSTKKAPERGR